MAFKSLSLGNTYVKYSTCKAGDVLVEGRYVKSEQGKFGVQHYFKNLEGKVIVLNSSGQLNYAIENYEDNFKKYICRIIFQGRVKLEKGRFAGKEAINFEIMFDDGEGEIKTVTTPLEKCDEDLNLGDL